MNLDVNLADRKQLEQLRKELRHYLGVVEYALKDAGASQGNDTLPLPMSFPRASHWVGATDERVRRIIKDLPLQFDSTDIFLRFGEEAKTRRGAIKMSIKRAIEDKRIRVLTPGKGRRPTKFERAS